jgi:hypothetical protein
MLVSIEESFSQFTGLFGLGKLSNTVMLVKRMNPRTIKGNDRPLNMVYNAYEDWNRIGGGALLGPRWCCEALFPDHLGWKSA